MQTLLLIGVLVSLNALHSKCPVDGVLCVRALNLLSISDDR